MTGESSGGRFGDKGLEEGAFSTRKLQSNGRANIPDEFLDYAGLSESDSIAVVAKDGNLVITQANMDKISDVTSKEGGE